MGLEGPLIFIFPEKCIFTGPPALQQRSKKTSPVLDSYYFILNLNISNQSDMSNVSILRNILLSDFLVSNIFMVTIVNFTA